MNYNLILKVIPKLKFEYKKNYGFIKSKFKKIKIESSEVTLDNILKKKSSVGRFGDGELDLIHGKSLKFQNYNKDLAEKLSDVIKKSSDNFLVCVPYALKDVNVLDSKGSKWWKDNLYNNRLKWLKLLTKDVVYYDTYISRFYMEIRDKNRSQLIVKKWKEVWRDREIVIVEGEYSRLGVGNDLFNNTKSVERVICPNKNAFDKYREILEFFEKKNFNNKLILIALGPTATVLAYDLYLLGYQAIDIGHVDVEYEWYLRNATKKIAIENKYVNEVNDSMKHIENKDIKYQSQIIKFI